MKKFLSITASVLVIASCTDLPEPVETVLPEPASAVRYFGLGLPEDNLIPNKINIRVTE